VNLETAYDLLEKDNADLQTENDTLRALLREWLDTDPDYIHNCSDKLIERTKVALGKDDDKR